MTDRYVVIGNPVAHSRSPWIHTHFAQQLGLDVHYERVLAPLDGFEHTVRNLIARGIKGANVTVPFKHEAFELGSTHTQAATFAQAVNTLKFEADGRIQTDNTDGAGLCRDLTYQLAAQGLMLSDVQVVLLGAGGAAAGCISAFHQAGVLDLVVLNRTVSKADVLAQRAVNLGMKACAGALDDYPLMAQLTKPCVLVNASSSSLKGEVPPLHAGWLPRLVLAYDMMYGAQPTPFMLAISQQPSTAMVSDGLGMLVHQAALSFAWWTGKVPDAQATLIALRAELAVSKG